MVDHAAALAESFRDAYMLTRDLFAVTNLLVFAFALLYP